MKKKNDSSMDELKTSLQCSFNEISLHMIIFKDAVFINVFIIFPFH